MPGHVTDTCAQPASQVLWLADARFAVHSSASHSPVNALVKAPTFCFFFFFFARESNPTSAANMVSGVLITVANRGSPSSALCTLCLHQRRDACESRSRRTQGVPVYTECRRTVSTLGSIHAMPDMPATPKRHARLHCGFGLMPAHITERHSQQLHPVKLCHLRPPSFLRVRSAVSSD